MFTNFTITVNHYLIASIYLICKKKQLQNMEKSTIISVLLLMVLNNCEVNEKKYFLGHKDIYVIKKINSLQDLCTIGYSINTQLC